MIMHVQCQHIPIAFTIAIPKVICNVVTPLYYLIHVFDFSCLQYILKYTYMANYMAYIYIHSLLQCTSVKVFLSFLDLCHMSIECLIVGCLVANKKLDQNT